MKLLLVFLLIICGANNVLSQGLNNLWLLGYGSEHGLPYGGTNIEFSSGTANVYYQYRQMEFGRTQANITDANGQLQFYSNGYYIADRTGDTLMGGSGLNPSTYTSWYPDGLHIPQANLILPKPGSNSVYYLFHSTIDNDFISLPAAKYLYLTTIDMSLNNGLGAVVSKNQILLEDQLNTGKISAVKHANGRDWWVFCHKASSATFYRFLVTPDGVSAPDTQSIGNIRPPDSGQVNFSPDGSRFAYYQPQHGLLIMSFDRCSGLFSSPSVIAINDSAFGGGVAFSPNSEVLYVSSTKYVYQFDVTAPDIASSKQTVAVWDGFYSPSPPFATMFSSAQVAPDGKIYITTGNSTQHLHIINTPDSLGSACNLVQHGLQLPTYNYETLPNHPNYHLGALIGSPCDTLLSAAEPLNMINIELYPSPNNGEFSISFAPQPEQGVLQVYNVVGKLMHSEPIAVWSQQKRLSQPGLKPGVYHCRLSWGEKTGVVRFVRE